MNKADTLDLRTAVEAAYLLPPGVGNRLQLVTPVERDALIAEGRLLTWVKYSGCWDFEAIDPHAEIHRFFNSGMPSAEELERLHGDLDSWPYAVRMSVRWLHALETGSGPSCRCHLCRRRIRARLELGRIAFAYPDDPCFPEASRATMVVCMACARRPSLEARLRKATASFVNLVGATIAD
jgi:hypothetical protein